MPRARAVAQASRSHSTHLRRKASKAFFHSGWKPGRVCKALVFGKPTSTSVFRLSPLPRQRGIMSDLRNKLIRLAYQNPEAKKVLLPLLEKKGAQGENPLAARLVDTMMRDLHDKNWDGRHRIDHQKLGQWLVRMQEFAQGRSKHDPSRNSNFKSSDWPETLRFLERGPEIGHTNNYGTTTLKPLGDDFFRNLLKNRIQKARPWDPLGHGRPVPKEVMEQVEKEQMEAMFPGGLFDPLKDKQLDQDLRYYAHIASIDGFSFDEMKFLTEREANSAKAIIRGLKRIGVTHRDNFWAIMAFGDDDELEFVETGEEPRRIGGNWSKEMARFRGTGRKNRSIMEMAAKHFKRIKAQAENRMKEMGAKKWIMPDWGTYGT